VFSNTGTVMCPWNSRGARTYSDPSITQVLPHVLNPNKMKWNMDEIVFSCRGNVGTAMFCMERWEFFLSAFLKSLLRGTAVIIWVWNWRWYDAVWSHFICSLCIALVLYIKRWERVHSIISSTQNWKFFNLSLKNEKHVIQISGSVLHRISIQFM
jgi:hypothetical protein